MQINRQGKPDPIFTHEGGRAVPVRPEVELRRRVMTCLLWEPTFYESGEGIAEGIAELVPRVAPEVVAALAVEARTVQHLRHVPLFLVRELARIKGTGPLVRRTLAQVIQRADELAEFLALYWKEGKCPISAGVKKGLADAFGKFGEYALAKYDRAKAVKLRDVMFLTHPRPTDPELYKRIAQRELEVPLTWEVELSAGKDKRVTFEKLMQEGKLGGLATLRNLRNMQEAGVDKALVRERLAQGLDKVLPFRYCTAARMVPQWEGLLEAPMLRSLEGHPKLEGVTGLLVDVSGSMYGRLSAKGTATRVDVAAGLAILLRELGECEVWTFSHDVVAVPARRGFALRDAIAQSQRHGATHLRKALEWLHRKAKLDRLIVITDEQSQDGGYPAWLQKSYLVNVASYKNGVGYRDGWTHIDGWSEGVVGWILEEERGICE